MSVSNIKKYNVRIDMAVASGSAIQYVENMVKNQLCHGLDVSKIDIKVNRAEDKQESGDTGQHMHRLICKELTETYIKKNHDYGDAFSETYDKLGIISAVTRITDKTNRLVSLCTKEQRVDDETLEDTLMDLANYAIMTVMEMGKEEPSE